MRIAAAAVLAAFILSYRADGHTAEHSSPSAEEKPEVIVFQGTTKFKATVDETGRVRDCIVTGSSGNVDYDQKTCAVLKEKGRFKLKFGPDNKPHPYTFENSIMWRIVE